jgi:hypothetical protein
MSARSLLVALTSSGLALAGGGHVLGYGQATGYFKQDARPTLYQPLNLLDGRDATAWCSPTADPLNELLTFGFNGPVRLEELRITTGNNFDEGNWNTFARARKLAIKAGRQTQTFTLEDVRGPQVITLKPAMVAARFSIEVLDQYPAEDPDQPVCMTDIVFVAEGKPLNGPWLTTKLKFDRSQAALLGTWNAGFEGTPDRFLSFNFDGTFRYSYEPFDETRAAPKVLEGTYDASAGRLVLALAGKKHQLKFARDPRKGGGFSLALDGDVPEDLKTAWRTVP